MVTRSLATREALLSLMQLSDSFFPSGMYTTSSGLEALFYAGKVTTPREFERLARSYLHMQVGQADCVALGIAFEAASSSDLRHVEEIDQRLYSMKLPAAMREASTRMGKQLLDSVGEFVDSGLLERYRRAIARGRAPGTQPVVLGVVSSVLGIAGEDSAFILLYSSLVALLGAGLRLAIIDHVQGQRIIHSLKQDIMLLSKNASRGPSAMWQFFPALEIAQMAHERIENKMFAT
jgi:urease accessory protein